MLFRCYRLLRFRLRVGPIFPSWRYFVVKVTEKIITSFHPAPPAVSSCLGTNPCLEMLFIFRPSPVVTYFQHRFFSFILASLLHSYPKYESRVQSCLIRFNPAACKAIKQCRIENTTKLNPVLTYVKKLIRK